MPSVFLPTLAVFVIWGVGFLLVQWWSESRFWK